MTTWPTVDSNDVPWLDTEQMIEVDRVMIEDLNIELIQMMENAGRNLARLALGLWTPASVVVAAGRGGNGGGGLVAARHLANQGVDVTVVVTKPPSDYWGVPGHQLDIVERMGLRVTEDLAVTGDVSVFDGADLVVDALIGYSLRGAPQGSTSAAIEAIAASERPVLSLDVPSGVDTATGLAPGVHVEADVTLTLALPKLGLRGHPAVGRLFVGDISVPSAVYLGIDGVEAAERAAGLFVASPIVEITATQHR